MRRRVSSIGCLQPSYQSGSNAFSNRVNAGLPKPIKAEPPPAADDAAGLPLNLWRHHPQ